MAQFKGRRLKMIAHYFSKNTFVVNNPLIANKRIFDQSFLVSLLSFCIYYT